MIHTREYILSRIKEIIHSADPGAQAILFGSKARGDSHEDSDWDVLILVDKEKIKNEDFDSIAYPVIELGWQINEPIHPILYTFKEWAKRNFTPLYKNIEQDGILL